VALNGSIFKDTLWAPEHYSRLNHLLSRAPFCPTFDMSYSTKNDKTTICCNYFVVLVYVALYWSAYIYNWNCSI